MFIFLSRIALLVSFLFVNHIFTSQELTTFHRYTELHPDLQALVIRKMDPKTIRNLAETSASQRNLIEHLLNTKVLGYSRTSTIINNQRPFIFHPFNQMDGADKKRKRESDERDLQDSNKRFLHLRKANRNFWADMALEPADLNDPNAEDTTVRALQLLFKKNEDENNC